MKGLKRELRGKGISRYLFVLLIMLFVINISRWGSITAKAASDIPKELIITEADGKEVQVIQNGKYVTTSGKGWYFETQTIPPYLVLKDAEIERSIVLAVILGLFCMMITQWMVILSLTLAKRNVH